jgi:cell division inhibitor SepF
MEGTVKERVGFFRGVRDFFSRGEQIEEVIEETDVAQAGSAASRPSYRYTITVRRTINSKEDMIAAAHGLKRGEGQVLNLTETEPLLRNKIVDFMSGVNFSEDGTWEEIGENIYMVVPALAYVEVAPQTPRSAAVRN